jgi:predicted NAD/FAD-binding protein
MQKLAIIGSGIAGMGCAYHLHKHYDITVFERNDYVGGHTNTISVKEEDRDVYMDTGFMVFNFETYPHLCNLFKEINAPIKKTDMSFSVQHRPSRLEFCGSGINGLFAQRKNIFSPSYIRMLVQIARFNKESLEVLDNEAYAGFTVGQYVRKKGFGEDMLWKYLVPMSSAVWSTPMDQMLDFPITTLVRFFKNHGFLGLNTQHQWYTLDKGSQSYREILIRPFRERIKVNSEVVKVRRIGQQVEVVCASGESSLFHKVIFASHANETLAMLSDATQTEKRLLMPFKYQKNIAMVHTDESVMPVNRRTWSSWNYSIADVNGTPEATTVYWMNRLQGVSDKKNYFVSINPLPGSVSPEKIIRSIEYEHPLFDVAAINAQAELDSLNHGGPVYFCGSYFRYGFHEDAYASAVKLSTYLKQTTTFPEQ